MNPQFIFKKLFNKIRGMTKLWIFMLLTLSITPFSVAISQTNQRDISPEEMSALCEMLSEVAAFVMKQRQNGVPASKAAEYTYLVIDKGGNNPLAKPTKSMVPKYIKFAFSTKIHQTNEKKQNAIDEFRNIAYIGCLPKE